MKKFLLFMGGAAIGLAVQAQSLPRPVYMLDFEGAKAVADFGGIQHGDGALVESEDAHFGTYYQNMPNGSAATNRVNFLEVPTDAWVSIYAKDTKTLSIGFWVNATVANEKSIGNYWGPLFNGYNEGGCAGATWPCSYEVRYGGQVHGNNNGAWYDNNHDDVKEDVMKWSVQSAEKPDFADNWHYFTTVYSNVDQQQMNFKLYIDGELKIDVDEVVSGETNMWAQTNKLDRFCIGGNSFNWADPDNAYAYDDVAFYAEALTKDDIDLIINMKLGQLTENDKLAIARDQLYSAKVDLSDYCDELGTDFSALSDEVGDWLMEDIGEPNDYESVEAIKAAMTKIQEKQQEVAAVVSAYQEAVRRLDFYMTYCDNTDFDGADAFRVALETAKTAIANPTDADAFVEAMQKVETAKVDYVLSQNGEVKDMTRLINDPWFIDEPYEPVADETEEWKFVEDAAAHLSKEGWTMTASDNLKGATDLALYYTNGRSTANLFHNSTAANGVLDLQQTLTGLPKGFYEVSADMSSTSEPTNNHVYAVSGGVTKVSDVPTSLPWSGVAEWTTLTTQKVYVGEDGTMTVGATSTTDGTQYKGWFCVTNFQLKYYGETYDMSADLAAQKTATEEAIAKLIFEGDKSAAQAQYDGILNSAGTDYDKLSQLEVLAQNAADTYAKETAFTRAQQLKDLAVATASDVNLSSVYNIGFSAISQALQAEGTTVNDLAALNELYVAYMCYASTIKAAEAWPQEMVTGKIAEYVNAVSDATKEEIVAKQAELIAEMKANIPFIEASEECPQEISALIGNASFDNDLETAWQRTLDGGTTAVSQAEMEFYDNNTFDLSQVLTGMPKGKYRLVASGFYRDGNDYAAVVSNFWTKDAEDPGKTVYDTHANAKLYVKSATLDESKPLVSIASDSLACRSEEDDTYKDFYGTTLHVVGDFITLDTDADPVVNYPFWMSNAYRMITLEGLYDGNVVDFSITEDAEDITVGVAKTAHIAGDWTIVDNFRLYYLGGAVIPAGIEDVRGAASVADGKYIEDGRIVIVKNGVKYNVAGQTVK